MFNTSYYCLVSPSKFAELNNSAVAMPNEMALLRSNTNAGGEVDTVSIGKNQEENQEENQESLGNRSLSHAYPFSQAFTGLFVRGKLRFPRSIFGYSPPQIPDNRPTLLFLPAKKY